jgi:hypothetical protein
MEEPSRHIGCSNFEEGSIGTAGEGETFRAAYERYRITRQMEKSLLGTSTRKNRLAPEAEQERAANGVSAVAPSPCFSVCALRCHLSR